jgi:hypothetical protein
MRNLICSLFVFFSVVSCKESFNADIDLSTFNEVEVLPISENGVTSYLLKSKINVNPNQKISNYGFVYSYKNSVFDEIFNDSLKILYTFNGTINQSIDFQDTIHNMALPAAYAVKPYAINDGRITLGKEISVTPVVNSAQKIIAPTFLSGALNAFGLSNGNIAIVGGGKDNRLYTRIDANTLLFSEPADTLPLDFANEYCTTFTIGNYGYVVGGILNGLISDQVYRYNFLNNSWQKMQNFPGGARHSAVASVINDKAYFGLGAGNGNLPADFWVYDTTNDSWSQLSSFPPQLNGRWSANSFVIGNNLYIVGGNTSSTVSAPQYSNSFWQFNSQTNVWKKLPDCLFKLARCFNYNYKNEGYIGFGNIGEYNNIIVGYNEPNAKWFGYYDGVNGALGNSNKAFAINLNQKVFVANFQNNELLRVK